MRGPFHTPRGYATEISHLPKASQYFHRIIGSTVTITTAASSTPTFT